MVALRDVVAVSGGGTPRKSEARYYGGGIPWVTPKDMKRQVIGESAITLTKDGVRNSPVKLVPEGSVLVVVRSGVLKHTLPVAVTNRPVTVNQDMKALTPVPELDSSYLARMLKSMQARVLSWVRATTADNFPIDSLLDLAFELPPLAEQRRIAAILDHADALRAKRRQVVAHLDTLTQAIFHEMFGDPDHAAEECRFGEIAGLSAGRNLVADDLGAASDFRVLKISAVTSGRFKADESKPLPSTYTPPPAHLVREGDLLMSRANTAELVGAVAHVALAPPGLTLPDKIWRFEWRVPSEPLFYHALFGTPAIRRRISQLASGTGGSMKNISKAKLETMKLPNVELDQQRRFVARMESLGQSLRPMTQAAATDDELFASLQSRAFKGEL